MGEHSDHANVTRPATRSASRPGGLPPRARRGPLTPARLAAAVEGLEPRRLFSVVGFSPTTYALGSNTVARAVGDFNGDGLPDLAFVNATSSDYSILLGTGGGAFQTAPRVSLGAVRPASVAVADVNADGVPDLVVGFGADSRVAVLRGKGDGTFRAPVLYQAGAPAEVVAAGDLNGDGRADLVAASYSTDEVRVLLGATGGGFAAPTRLAAVTDPIGLTLADWDGDGKLDLAVAPYPSAVLLYWGNGDGTFGPTPTQVGSAAEGDVVAADFNADGRLDVAAALAPGTGRGVTLALNNGGRSFRTAVTVPTPVNPDNVSGGDFNADGKADLVTLSGTFLLGNGDGTFQIPTAVGLAVSGVPTGYRPAGVGDLNGDGLTDLYGYTEGPTAILLGRPVAGVARDLTGYDVAGAEVATFSDWLLPNPSPALPTATVDWGDGFVSAGVVVADGGGTYRVLGTHRYGYNATYTVQVTLTDAAGRSATAAGRDVVSDTPAAQDVTAIPLPTVGGTTAGFPNYLVAGPGGDLSFGYGTNATPTSPPNVIGRVTPAGVVSGVPTPENGSAVRELAVDGAGNIWFVETATQIGRLSPAGAVTTFPYPGGSSLTRGQDGNVWFVEPAVVDVVSKIGRIDAAGAVTHVTLSKTIGLVGGMALGPDGNFWATQVTAASYKIVRITPAGGVTEFALPAGGSATRYITTGPDGNLWFTADGGFVGKITPAGVATLYKVPTGLKPGRITAGPDGAVWFIDGTKLIARITQAGAVTDYAPPPRPPASGTSYANGLFGIAPGSDGNIWFTEQNLAYVGRVNLNRAPVLTPAALGPLTPGQSVLGAVASFTDPLGGRTPADFVATIDWGDGSVTPGTIAATAGGYDVVGTHPYPAAAARTVRVTVAARGDVAVTTYTPVTVGYALTAVDTYPLLAAEDVLSDPAPLLTFKDETPGGPFGPYTATIDWGDGQTSAGTVSPAGRAGVMDVSGGHLYAREGTYPVTVVVTSAGGTRATGRTTARVIGSLALAAPTVYAAGQFVLKDVVADFNGDGSPDVLAAVGQSPAVVRFLPGSRTGALGAPVDAGPTAGTFVSLAAGDLTGDGKADLAASRLLPGDVYSFDVYPGRGDGTFGTPVRVSGAVHTALKAGDLNGDGVADLVANGMGASGGFANYVQVYFANGNGTFRSATLPASDVVESAVIADATGDGKADVVANVSGANQFAVFAGDGRGGFSAPAYYPYAAPSTPSRGLEFLSAADVNGDGRVDVVAAGTALNRLAVVLNTGAGFGPPAVEALDAFAGNTSSARFAAQAVTDVNGDGLADLVLGGNGGLAVRLGNGDGSFQTIRVFSVSQAAPQVTPVDMNGDGRVDFVSGGNPVNGGFVVALNNAYTITPVSLPAKEGISTGPWVVAALRHDDVALTDATGFTATIDWGDGTSSPATVRPFAGGELVVEGSHTYNLVGNRTATVTVLTADGVRLSTTTAVTVADAPFSLTPRSFAATRNAEATVALATLTDANVFSAASQFVVQVAWGDGVTSPGLLRLDAPGRYTIFGTHRYAAAGAFTATVTVTEAAASGGGTGTITTSGTVLVPLAGGGSVSGTVFEDQNFDAARAAGEPPLALWTVYVDANNNGLPDGGEASALTSADGGYTLPDVPAGSWPVRLVLPAGWVQTAPAGDPVPVTVAAGQAVDGRDLGAARRPAAFIDPGPAARNTPLSTATITFNDAVTGFDLSDLRLTLGTGGNLLTAAQTLASSDGGRTWTLGNLAPLTAAQGTYVLTLDPAAGIVAASAGPVTVGATGTWRMDTTTPFVQSPSYSPAGVNPSQVFLFFSEDVYPTLAASDFTVANLTLGTVVPAAAYRLDYNRSGNQAVLSFPGLPNGRLIDSSYRLTLSGTGVADAAGNLLGPNNKAGTDFVLTFSQTTTSPPGLSAAAGSSYTISGPPTNKVLSVTAGTVTLAADLADVYPVVSVTVSGTGKVLITADQHLRDLTLNGPGASVVFGGTSSLAGLSFAGGPGSPVAVPVPAGGDPPPVTPPPTPAPEPVPTPTPTPTPASLPALSVGDAASAEGQSGRTAFRFVVKLDRPEAEAVRVRYATANITAAHGTDYAAAGGVLTFKPGETSKTVTVYVTGDRRVEADETFRVVLYDARGAVLADAEGAGTIRDDDAPPPAPKASAGDAAAAEGDAGTRAVSFDVTLDRPAAAAVTVRYATADGTARAGADYLAAAGALVFKPGETRKRVTVYVRGDRVREADETFFLTLSGPVGGGLGDAQGRGTIRNDD